MASAETAHIRQIDAIFGGEGLEPPPIPRGKERSGLPRKIGTRALRSANIPLEPRTMGVLFAEPEKPGNQSELTPFYVAQHDVPYSLRLTHLVKFGSSIRHQRSEWMSVGIQADPDFLLPTGRDLFEAQLTPRERAIVIALRHRDEIRSTATLLAAHYTPRHSDFSAKAGHFEFDENGMLLHSDTTRKDFDTVMNGVLAAIQSATSPIALTPPSYAIVDRYSQPIRTIDAQQSKG